MNAAMRMVRTSLIQPSQRTVLKRPRLIPMPNLSSMGNSQAHVIQLFSARMALRQRNIEQGFLVFVGTGEVKYYKEDYSFTVANLAAFTNMPVYRIGRW